MVSNCLQAKNIYLCFSAMKTELKLDILAQILSASKEGVNDKGYAICHELRISTCLVIDDLYSVHQWQLLVFISTCRDPFEEPECEACDVFVNETLCIGKGTFMQFDFLFHLLVNISYMNMSFLEQHQYINLYSLRNIYEHRLIRLAS